MSSRRRRRSSSRGRFSALFQAPARVGRSVSRKIKSTWKSFSKRLQIWRKKRANARKRLKGNIFKNWRRLGKRIRQPRWRHFLKGLPPILLAGAMFGTFLFYRNELSTRTQKYQQVAKASLDQDNFDLSHLAYERLCLDFPTNPEYRFGLAMSSLGKKDIQGCESILEEIAPLESPGYYQAHLFLANLYMQPSNRTPGNLLRAENHLLRALQTNQAGSVASVTLAQLYRITNRDNLAERYLKDVESSNPQASLLLAQLYRDQKMPEQSRTYAIRARDNFMGFVRENPNNSTKRLELAEAYNMLGQYPDSYETLRGITSEEDDPQRKIMLERTLSLWIDDSKVCLMKRLDLIEEGLRLNPESVRFLEKLVEASRAEGEGGDKARKQLDSLMKAGGPNLPMVYLVLGIDAQKRNLLNESRAFLEKGFGDNPRMPEVANNLAWLLTQGENPDLLRALTLTNEAIKRSPRDLRIRDTRGQILAKMGRWKEALEDLEPCVPVFPNDPALHKTLAEVYGKLNMPEPAKAHDRIAKALAVKP